MSLSCYCGDEFDWYYYAPTDMTVLGARRARRCCSCHTRIGPQDQCAVFERTREPNDYIEERIYGEGPEAVPLAPRYMCETCFDLYSALDEHGYCIKLGDDMRALVREHAQFVRVRRADALDGGER